MDNTNSRNYSVQIVESSDELSAIEKVRLKDTTDCVRLDQALEGADAITIKVMKYVVLNIHNEKSEDKDYPNFIIVDEDGTKYITGSRNFFDTFKDIHDELKDCNEEWYLKIYKVDSKNYKGKQFITCSVA